MEKKPPFFNSTFKVFAIAAGLALLILGGKYTFFTQPSSLQFALQEYKKIPYELSGQKRTSSVGYSSSEFSKNEENLLSNDKQQIIEALHFFETIPPSDSNYLNAIYCLGHASFLVEKYDQAIKNFSFYFDEASRSHRERDYAQFYLVLSYLADENEEKAMEEYGRLKNNNIRFKNHEGLKEYFSEKNQTH